MPQNYNPGIGQQDWAPVNAGRSGAGPIRPTAVPKTARAIDQAKAQGLITTEKRFGAGGNKSAHSGGGAVTGTTLSARALEEADDVGTLARVDKALSKAIMQARMAQKLTQKDLATAVNEKPQVIGDYEAGRAIPNPQIITKLERKLGVKLPRPTTKSVVPTKSATTTATTTGAGRVGGGTGNRPAGNGLTRGGPPKRR